jgi:phosphatidylglycerophosphate synthase
MQALLWIRTWLWDVEPIRYYISALVVSLAVVLLPRKTVIALGNTAIGSGILKQPISRLPPKWQESFGPVLMFSANMVSVWRLLIFWVGYILFHFQNPIDQYIGFCLMALGIAMDRLDGRIAQICGQITAFGEWFDPLIDKLTLTVIVVDLALVCLIPPVWHSLMIGLPCIMIIVIAEITGILVRPPFDLWSRRRKSVKATGIGKMKFLLMGVYLLVALPIYMNWFKIPSWGIYYYLIMCGLLATLSVASRFVYPWKWVNKLVQASNKPFLHIKRNDVKIYFGRLWRIFFRKKRNSNSGIKAAITR